MHACAYEYEVVFVCGYTCMCGLLEDVRRGVGNVWVWVWVWVYGRRIGVRALLEVEVRIESAAAPWDDS